MVQTIHDDTECVIYTEGFRNRIHCNVVLPPQVFGKFTLLDFLNQHERITIQNFRFHRREGVEFVAEKPSPHVDPAAQSHVPTSTISLMHGYPQYGFLSKADDERLRRLSYEEIAVFVRYVIEPSQPSELIFGRLLGKVHGVYADALAARNNAVNEVFKQRPHFVALRDPSNTLLRNWFGNEHDWKTRKNHQAQPPSIILNRRFISFYGVQKTDEAA